MTRIADDGELKIDMVSMLPAPRCEGCGLPMKDFDELRWECPGCGTGPVVVDGVYPFRIIERKGTR